MRIKPWQWVLLSAADVIENGHWCQYNMALADDSRIVSVDHKDAVRFCAVGVVFAASKALGVSDAARKIALNKSNVFSANGDIMSFNDAPTTTAKKVANVMRKATGLV